MSGHLLTSNIKTRYYSGKNRLSGILFTFLNILDTFREVGN